MKTTMFLLLSVLLAGLLAFSCGDDDNDSAENNAGAEDLQGVSAAQVADVSPEQDPGRLFAGVEEDFDPRGGSAAVEIAEDLGSIDAAAGGDEGDQGLHFVQGDESFGEDPGFVAAAGQR